MRFEGQPIPEEMLIKEQRLELKNFSKEEIENITDVDILKFHPEKISSETLAKINTENIDPILDSEDKRIANERQKNIEQLTTLDTMLDFLKNVSSSHHKLLCATNGREDFNKFKEILERLIQEKKIEENDKRVAYLSEVINRQIEICEIEKELFKIDIKRRIGNLKNENLFFQKSVPQIEKLVPKIDKILNYFNQEEIKSKSEKIKNLLGETEGLLNLIKDKKFESLENRFYDFCLNLSKLRLIDFEELNEKEIEEKVKNLVESYK